MTFVKKYLGALILILALTLSTLQVIINQARYEAPDVKTIRICHFQLEAGFRQALQQLIDEYEEHYAKTRGEKLRIVQLPISQRGYEQFVNTSLIGQTAPDIIETDPLVRTTQDAAYVSRFFLPLGEYVSTPNPYTAGTALEQLPWKETFFDGLQSAFKKRLLDYYHIPFSIFTIRMYYNIDLYEELTGKTEPPASYQEFQDVCGQILEKGRHSPELLVPIAGSKYQAAVLGSRYERPFFVDLSQKIDTNLDGEVSEAEAWLGYQEGAYLLNDPVFIASWNCSVEISKNFQKGWISSQRDDATFLFLQQNAVMLASGSWDAASILKQAEGKFRVGIFDFPMPIDHPAYSRFVKGPLGEGNIQGGIPWAVTKQSAHPEICLDFLRFCTTPERNEAFNKQITWLPVVNGAQPKDILKPFTPRLAGFQTEFRYQNLSTALRMIEKGARWQLLSGQITPEEYAARLSQTLERSGEQGFLKNMEKDELTQRDTNRMLAAKLALASRSASAPPKKTEQQIQQLTEFRLDSCHQSAVSRHRYEIIKQGEAE
ncbi:ABC transporter substrate-binding protein [Tichowtungia aerotolerans]|uniref:Extracellular solute-binding protein n=1 Tax=Tichowtungia aerotolerans TaxID=2697043 RepID=A0A6P1M1Q2_9BACT|nr:extracellular solute-binding protein [Tichowtungia aerotolerans]QHI68042.1 extracellular solute-binding protein [Tichowtungia aerotolerans]